MKKSLVGKGVATLAIMTAMPLMGTVQAFADTSNNSFSNQYQTNQTKESSLLQTAQSSSFTNSYTQALSSTVQNINSEVSTLYNAEQTLAAQRSQTAQLEQQNLSANLSQLEQERMNLLHQSEDAWGTVKFWFFRHQDRYTEDRVHQARQKWSNIGIKVKGINEEIKNLRQQDHWQRSPYDGGLSSLQQSILRLQQSAIHYTQEWIAAEQNQSTTSSTLSTPWVSVSYSNGAYNLEVSSATSGATVTLYNNATGQEVSSSTVASNGTAAFNDIASGTYYVVQTLNGVTSNRSNVVSVNMNNTVSTPSVSVNYSNGVYDLEVSGATSGATVMLYNNATGQEVSSSTVAYNGTAAFNNVASGTYYVVQTLNGVTSNRSNVVSVNNTLPTPVIAIGQNNGFTQVTLSNGVSGATAYLYNTSGTLVSSTSVNSSGDAAFNNVAAGSYYVTEYQNSQQTARSNTVTVSNALATPSVYPTNTNGTSGLYVTNVVPGASVILYSSTGAQVSSTTAGSTGDAAFNGLSAGNYYVTQIYNGSPSGSSSIVYVN